MRGVTCAISTLIQVMKIFILVAFALFSPQFFLNYSVHYCSYWRRANDLFKLGLENISAVEKDFFSIPLTDSRVLLITNQAGIDQQGNQNIDLLLERGVNVKKIMIPTSENKKERVLLSSKKLTSMSIDHLYTAHNQLKKNISADFDLMVFDLPDSNLSHEQYVAVIRDILSLAVKYKKPVVILDRPTLFSAKIEGVFADHAQMPLPLHVGMTVAEFMGYMNKKVFDAQAELRIVPMCNYKRVITEQKQLREHPIGTELTPDNSSINNLLAILAHVHPLDVGMGADRAFEYLLLPESLKFERQKWYELQICLRNQGIESRFYRHFNASKKEYYHGLQCNMNGIREHSTINSLLAVLMFFKRSGLSLQFSPHFDSAVGTPLVREVVLGTKSYRQLQEQVNADLRAFFDQAQDAFIYTPLPEIIFV